MRGKYSVLSILFSVMFMFLLLVIASRATETTKKVSVDGYTAVMQPALGTEGMELSADSTPIPTPAPTPKLILPSIDINSWEYMLANNSNNISTYTPVVVPIEGTTQFFDERAISYLNEFLEGARAAGFSPHINAGYRPYSSQRYLFNGKASQISWDGTYTYAEAVELAKKIVAPPGASEHQTGLAVDITDKHYKIMDLEAMDKNLLAWLKEHCYEYGFILRYPDKKEAITGWNEPWHFRYVGKEVAKFMTKNNLCLEQFLELYKKQETAK
ncbi:MAG: M15 family metallopeptidase [Ruminococcaceae bacterium]|nr:M15 family metallopeptidase [Oscillospiraceae bacterium]